jgi:hypothetical protein
VTFADVRSHFGSSTRAPVTVTVPGGTRCDGSKLHISVDVDSDLSVAGAVSTATTGDDELLAGLLDHDRSRRSR